MLANQNTGFNAHFQSVVVYTIVVNSPPDYVEDNPLIINYSWLTCCRGQPPDYVLKDAKNASKFFKCIGSVHTLENGEVSLGGRSAYQALTVDEYEAVSVHLVVLEGKSLNSKDCLI